jgi:hypothetical protein
MPISQSAPDPIDAFEALHAALFKAIMASTDPDATETMRQADEVVAQAITALNQADFRERTDEFRRLSASVNAHLKSLNDLKARIDGIIANITLATRVASAIDGALAAASKVFPFSPIP